MFGAIFVARTAFKCPGRAADAVQWWRRNERSKKKVGRYDALCGPSDVLFLAVSLKRWLVGVLLQLEELCARQHPNVNPERLFLIAHGGISLNGFNFFCSISETLQNAAKFTTTF